jgi:hypothetical protein
MWSSTAGIRLGITSRIVSIRYRIDEKGRLDGALFAQIGRPYRTESGKKFMAIPLMQ